MICLTIEVFLLPTPGLTILTLWLFMPHSEWPYHHMSKYNSDKISQRNLLWFTKFSIGIPIYSYGDS